MQAQRPVRQRRLLVGAVFYVNVLSLGCQLLWVRRFNVLFGSTAAVFGSVLCAFLLGLAIGAEVGGRRAARERQPWRALGGLLVALGVYVCASMWLLDAARWAYLRLAPQDLVGVQAALHKLPLVLLLVVPPTVLIGSVLPLAVTLLVREGAAGRTIALLYGADTAGAAIGAALGGFLLVPHLGLRISSWVLGLGAVALGLVMRRASGIEPAADAPARAPAPPARVVKKKQKGSRRPGAAGGAVAAETFAPPEGWRATAVLASFALTGCAALLLETGWNRFFYVLNGTSIFSLAVVLTGFLAGIGLGSVLVARRLDARGNLYVLVAGLQLLVAVGGMLVFRSEELFGRTYLAFFGSTQSYLAFQTLVCALIFLIVFAATVAMGANFPAVARLLTPSREGAGAATGRAYLVNTMGAVVGAFVGEFVLLPRLGFAGLMATVTVLYVGSAILFFALAKRRSTGHWLLLGALAAAALALTPPLRAFEPPANAVYYTGVRRGTWDSYQALNDSLTTIWRRQGFYGQVAVLRGEDGTIYLKHNGKSDASSSATDNFAQLMLGHLPLLLHPQAATVLNIGLGGGITLGAISGHPEVKRIVQVEIDPLVAEAARTHFGPYNRRGLEDPRLRLVIDDGRNFVERTAERFDVIVSEPPNIWVSGVSALFTEQFYRAAKGRLTPGGLLCQWLPLYELDPADFAGALHTIASVFPHLSVWTNGAVAIVLASESPIPTTAPLPPPAAVAADLDSVGVTAEKLPGVLATPDLAGDALDAWLRRATFVNRDDRPRLEFDCARNLFEQQKDPTSWRWRAALQRQR